MRPQDVGEDGENHGGEVAGQRERDIRTAIVAGRQRVDEVQADTITRAEDSEVHGRMVRGDDLGRLTLDGQPGVEDDESRLDGVNVVKPVPESDHRTGNKCRTQTIAEAETGSCFGNAQQAEEAGRCSEHKTMVRAKPTETKAGVELPETEPVGAESGDDVGEYHR